VVDHRYDVACFDRTVGEDMEPRTTEVRQSRVVDVQEVAHGADDTRVADDERGAVLAATTNVEERARHAFEDVVVALKTIRLSSVLEKPRPLCFDLRAGKALPRTDVCLLQSLVHFDGADTEMFSDDRGGVPGALELTRGNELERAESVCCERCLAHTFLAERNVGPTLPALLNVPQ